MTTREPISTDGAPDAIGPYSQAVRVGQVVYLSGQIPLNPATMDIVEGDIEVQTRRVFDSLAAVAHASGGSLADIVKLTIYLVDLEQFAQVNKVMTEYFEPPYPARATVAVAGLPKGVPVEVEAVLHLPD